MRPPSPLPAGAGPRPLFSPGTQCSACSRWAGAIPHTPDSGHYGLTPGDVRDGSRWLCPGTHGTGPCLSYGAGNRSHSGPRLSCGAGKGPPASPHTVPCHRWPTLGGDTRVGVVASTALHVGVCGVTVTMPTAKQRQMGITGAALLRAPVTAEGLPTGISAGRAMHPCAGIGVIAHRRPPSHVASGDHAPWL
jgi:hypothetical protein